MPGKETPHAFLKWAGGKLRLIPEIQKRFPACVRQNESFNYVEPFVGGGAMLWHISRNFPKAEKIVINDINTDLYAAYQSLKTQPEKLILLLEKHRKTYLKISSEEQRKAFFLEQREIFNTRKSSMVKHAALLIFLNKTCFNGLYRVNAKGKFNVPFGRYKNPGIFDSENLKSVSDFLQKTEILNSDFEKTLDFATPNTLFYLDPPYKPLSKSASFTAYSTDKFDDNDQQRLKSFCDKIHSAGSFFILSNSDPKNTDPDNNFFEELYRDYTIEKIQARRAINSDASKRGAIFELLIRNF